MRVYLVGYMASGKSSAGRHLAEALAWPFVDLDKEIVRRTGRSIRDIFDRFGEPTFRRVEMDVLHDTTRLDDAVIATGGGTFAVPAGRDWIARQGLSVWLDVPFPVLLRRIASSGPLDRPKFRDEQQALELFRARADAYSTADLRLALTGEETPTEIAARVALEVERRCAT